MSNPVQIIAVIVAVIVQQLFCYRRLSRLRKSVTAAGLFHRSCTVSCVGWLWQLNRCSAECGVTNIWYAAGDVGLVTVQELAVTRTQLGKCGTDWPREQIFERWDIRWRSSKTQTNPQKLSRRHSFHDIDDDDDDDDFQCCRYVEHQNNICGWCYVSRYSEYKISTRCYSAILKNLMKSKYVMLFSCYISHNTNRTVCITSECNLTSE